METDKPLKLTDEVLIEEFNSEQLNGPAIARKYQYPLSQLKSRIQGLQKRGVIGYKNRSGKIVRQPGEPAPKRKNGGKQKEESLEELLKDVNLEANGPQISTYHKELLVEVLHKLIC